MARINYYWKEPILYKHCTDQVIRRCVPKDEMGSILTHVGDTLEAKGDSRKS